jgi:hypothetical protein
MAEIDFQLTARQKRIREGLLAIDEIIAMTYEGAYRVLLDQSNPDRFSQSAHSFREVTAQLSRLKEIPQEVIDDSDEERKEDKEKMRTKLKENFGLGEENILPIVQKDLEIFLQNWIKIYKSLLGVTHHGKVIGVSLTEDEFNIMVDKLEDVLDYVLRPSSLTISEIDVFLHIENPTTDDVKRLLKKIAPSSIYAEYFFSRLTNAKWLIPLKEAGVFIQPPNEVVKNGFILFPIWWPTSYLKGMAKDHEELVIEIIVAMKITSNFRVQTDLIDAALSMTASKSSEIVPFVLEWIHTIYPSLVTMKARELCEKLITEETKDSAFTLLHGILCLGVSGQDQKLIEDRATWEIDQLVEKVVPKFTAVYPIETMQTLCSVLDFRMKLKDKTADGYSFYSHIWRPAIEPHPQNSERDDFDNILIDGIRDGLDTLGNSDADNLLKIIEILDRMEHPIFQRLKIYVITKYPFLLKDTIMPVITNMDLLESVDCWHEIFHLLNNQFSFLSKFEQNQFFEIIRGGLRSETISRRCEKLQKDETPENKTKMIQTIFRRRLMAPIKDCLPDDLAKMLEAIEQTQGPLEHADFAGGYVLTSWSSDHSSDMEIIKDLDNGELIDLFKDRPKKYLPFGFDLEGSFEKMVSSDVNKFVDTSIKISEVPLEYIIHVLYGTHNAIKKEISVDWPRIISFIDKLVSHDWNATHPETHGLYSVDNVHSACFDILSSYFQKVPYDNLKNEVWSIVKKLLDLCVHPNINKPCEELKKEDLIGHALNDPSGKGVDILIKYLRWASRAHSEDIVEQLDDEPRLVLENILRKMLDIKSITRTTLGIHFVEIYAAFPIWTRKNLEIFFPDVTKHRMDWKMTWEGYIRVNRLYRDIYDNLQPQYLTAANKIECFSDEARNETIRHLVLAYLYGYNTLEKSGLKNLIANASPEVRGRVLKYMGNSLERTLNLKLDKVGHIVDRSRDYWDWRLQEYESGGASKKKYSKTELNPIHRLFVALPTSEKNDLLRLKRTLDLTGGFIERSQEIIEKLIGYIGIDDILLLAILSSIMKADYPDWEKDYCRKDLLKLLGLLNQSRGDKIQLAIKTVAEICVKQGFFEFKEFC